MKYKYIPIFILLFAVTGCLKDSFKKDKFKKSKYEPIVAAPLVYTTLALKDMIKQSKNDLIHVDNDGFISLIYRSTLFSATAENLVTIPNQNYPQTVAPAINLPSFPVGNSQTYTETQVLTFAALPNQLDSIMLKAGTLDIASSSSFNANLDVTLTIPSATLNGVAFNKTISITAWATNSTSFDLTGYKLDLTNGGTTTNEFQAIFNLTLTGTGNAINPSDQLSVTLSISNMLFSKLFGIVALGDIAPQEDTVAISLFNTAAGIGDFSIVNPQVKLYTKNSFGTTIEATFNRMEGINTTSGVIYDLISSGSLPPLWSIAGPTYSEIGQTIPDSLIITGTNVVTMINDQPKYFVYDITATTPLPSAQLFMLDTSKIEFDAEIEIPMYGTIKNFTLIDTVGLDLGMEAIKALTLTSRVRNGFPIEFDVTFYTLEWINGAQTVTDSAYTGTSILFAKSGELNTNDRVVVKTETLSDIALNATQTQHFATASSMIIKAVASTTGNGTKNVKFYSDYALEIKIGAIAEIAIEF